ncbi:unnamed protein product [Heligmosomoides polygyrus]|uniref:Ig-like domain-containing protein n=1 Tax=Heligmosomoides polygyrus TaxID=6339 RepID=A0A3P8FL85_HELPZ|nr:unnamed protein product [Heligmosomoides polygyrus]
MTSLSSVGIDVLLIVDDADSDQLWIQHDDEIVTDEVPVVTRQWDTWFTPVPSRDDFALAATTPSSRLQEKTSEPLTKIEEKPSFAESPPPLLVQNRKISKETEFTTSTGTSTIIPTTIETTTPAPTATSLQPSPSTVKKFTGHSKKSTIRPSTVETTTSEASTEQPSPTTVKKFTAHSKKSTIRPSTVETTTSEASTEQPSPTTVKKFTAHSKKSTIRPTTLETTTPEASTEKLSPTTVKKFTIKWTETSHLRRTTRPTTVAPVSTTEPPTTSALPTRPTRPPQPKPVFTFATIMGVRRQKLTTTVSPRPGGIWRRGRIIFEDDTTTTSSPSTTTARATATAPNKSTKSYNREQASEEHLSIDQRVESAATATTTSEDFTRSPQLQRRPSRLLQRLELEKGHQDAPASTQQTVAPKPVVIQQGSERYKGPTFNCRILNPFEDGVATANHDPSCPMAMPGLSKDGFVSRRKWVRHWFLLCMQAIVEL